MQQKIKIAKWLLEVDIDSIRFCCFIAMESREK